MSARAQFGTVPPPAACVPGELCVFPSEAYRGWIIAEELKQAGYLVLGIAPLSGMVLVAVPVPEIAPICRDLVSLRTDVKSVEYNRTGNSGAQPACTGAVDPSCTYDPTVPHICCDTPYPSLQITQPWPPTPAGQYPSTGVPNDPDFKYQWGIANIGQTIFDRTCGATCNAPQLARQGVDMGVLQAWRRTTGSPNITVAILDTGVATCNPDFDPTRFMEDDIALVCPGNGYATYPCCPGGVAGSSCIYTHAGDQRGHGTFVASIIGATVNNGLGIAGVDQQCKMLAASTSGLDTSGSNLGRTIIALEEIATDPKYDSVRVINMSTGHDCSAGSSGETTIDQVVDLLHAQNRFIVSISHNGGIGSTGSLCPNNSPKVLMIGGIDGRGWRFQTACIYASGTGPAIDFMAPGYAMIGLVCQTDACATYHHPAPCPYSPTFPCQENQTNFTSGTSWAAPMVSAAISLVLARAEFLQINENFASITFDDMYQILRQSVVDTSADPTRDPEDTPGWDSHYGWGLVNAHQAMLALERNHYFCRADRTTNNILGSPGHGIPDGHVTPDDLAYFED